MNRRLLLASLLGLTVVGTASLWPAGEAGAAERSPVPGRKPGTGLPISGRNPGNGVPRKPRPPHVVVIDPGHGGHDPGAIGANGTYEKDVTLDLGLEMGRRLTDRGLRVVLTRNRDIFLPLADRVARARAARADFFISIHADSAPNREARGLSAYTISEKASDEFSKALAHRENLADGPGGLDLSDTDRQVAAILVDLAARHTLNTALQAKARLVTGAGRDLRLLDNPMRSANFAVLKAPDIPSVLVETGFLSNMEDEALLSNPRSRRAIAGVLAREVAVLMSNSPFI